MKLLSLTLRNFGSFTTEQTFHFPTASGLYFMWGDNQAEPRLEGNGAGKSTLWKALTWLFYAKTPAGLKAGDIANWGAAKNALVRLRYEMWGIELEVERTWSPNTWVLIAPNGHRTDLAKDPTNTCLEELRLEFTAFVQSVVLPQGADLFLDLKADKQAELFSDVMGLDRWLTRSQRASERARLEDSACRQLERDLSHVTGQLEAARSTNVENLLRDFEAGRRRRLEQLDAEHARYIKEAKVEEARVKVLKASADAARDRHDAALHAPHTSPKCETCGQSTDSGKHAAHLRNLLKEADDEMRAYRAGQNLLARVEASLDAIELDAEHAEREVNPYAKLRDEAEQRIAELERRAARLTQASDEAQTRFSVASAWVRWFKEIRLAQIGEALTQLEIEVNNQVGALGLLDWELRFDVDKESKSGTIQRGFSVTVLSPHNSKPVPWEAWSGGERQRLIVAAQMGLANLIRARTGTTVNLEVWDEPTTGMSAQGVEDLLAALHKRAEAEDRQVWVVDHRTLGFNKFTGHVGVIKTAQGSRFKSPADAV